MHECVIVYGMFSTRDNAVALTITLHYAFHRVGERAFIIWNDAPAFIFRRIKMKKQPLGHIFYPVQFQRN